MTTGATYKKHHKSYIVKTVYRQSSTIYHVHVHCTVFIIYYVI